MKLFSDLIQEIASTTKVTPKVNALVRYFESTDDASKLWAIALLSGKRPKRNVTISLLKQWAIEQSNLSIWLFEECYNMVGDQAEAISLLVPSPSAATPQTLDYWVRVLLDLKDKKEEAKKAIIQSAWDEMDRHSKFIFNKLISGGFRTEIPQKLVVQALVLYTGQDENNLAYKLTSNWDPLTISFETLVLSDSEELSHFNPYPFSEEHVLDGLPNEFGKISEWQIERKWEGLRVQVIIRNQTIHIWSQEGELVTDRYPELHDLVKHIADGAVMDCVIICHDGYSHLPFNLLKSRTGRKKITKKLLADAPIRLLSYDLLETKNQDIRGSSLASRRALLESLIMEANHDRLLITDVLRPASWEWADRMRSECRKYHSNGLLLKRNRAPYENESNTVNSLLWKVDPLTINAIMIYATRGQGPAAGHYSEFTFAVWNRDQLIPFTKAQIGLSDAELNKVGAFVKKNTVEKFGPVRSLNPELVFEIAFEDIQLSKRHKSGVVLRFPRIHQWLEEKPANEANTLADLMRLLDE